MILCLDGLTLFGADPRIQNCAFNNNTNFAIAMRGDCLPVLRNNTASGNGKNAIGIFGFYISRTGTWTRDNIPYTIYEEAQVNNGVTLTIEPGTVVQFERVFDGFHVDGTLVARGTPSSPILFTSDDAVKQPGQWRVLDFRSTASTNGVMETASWNAPQRQQVATSGISCLTARRPCSSPTAPSAAARTTGFIAVRLRR